MKNFVVIFFLSFFSLFITISCTSTNLQQKESNSAEPTSEQQKNTAEVKLQNKSSEKKVKKTVPENNIKEEQNTQETEVKPKEPVYEELVFDAYKTAYPDKNITVFFDQEKNDWCIRLDNSNFYWADGRLLSEENLKNKDSFGKQQIYPYTGEPRNPLLYTEEKIEELRKKGDTETISNELPVDTTFDYTLLGIKDRISTESHIKKSTLFNKRVNAHELVIPYLSKIDAEIKELSKTDRDIQNFLESIYEIGGYNWRTIAGTNERRSYHSYGVAIDVLIKNNKKTTYWKWEKVWNNNWMLVPQRKLWTPPEDVIHIFEKYGFIWGGTWDEYDTMHFEYRPELIVLNKKLNKLL